MYVIIIKHYYIIYQLETFKEKISYISHKNNILAAFKLN